MAVDLALVARRHGRRDALALRCAIGLVFAVGVLPVALELAQPHGLYGTTEYDDGVYFGAALRLVDGIFPYKDFVIVQPPGIAVILAPFAALSHLIGGRHALGAARIFTAVVAGLNAALVSWLLRGWGLPAVLTGGLALAVFPTGYTATHTFLLEPFCVCLCLVGAALVFDRAETASALRCVLGGACFGFAGAVKVFAIVPIVVLVVIFAITRRRHLLPFVAGVAAAVALFVLPFFLAAPSAFLHDVIASQLQRSTGRPTPFLDRLFAITGLAYSSPTLNPAPNIPSVPAGDLPSVLAGLGLSALAASVIVRLRDANERRPFVAFVLASAVGAVGITLVPAAYYDHYAYFTAAFLALLLGLGVAAVASVPQALVARLSGPRRRACSRPIAAAAALTLVAGSAAALWSSTTAQRTIVDRFGDPGPAIARSVPAGACTVTDAESILVSAGRAGIGGDRCPAIVDPTGLWLTIDPLHPPVRAGTGEKDPRLVAIWRAAFAGAQYAVFSGVCAFRIPWTASLAAWFDAHYSKAPGPYPFAYRHVAPATAAERPPMRATCAETDAAARTG